MPFLRTTLPLLLGIFLLSVLVRLPQLNRPLSKHHEFCTAVSLRILQIWHDEGIEKFGYNPVMTYGREADKYINNDANASGNMIDASGNYYYTSHPPFAYYFAHYFFKLLGVRPDVLPIQLLNLLFHFFSGLFVYFTVCLLSFNRGRSLPYVPAVVAFIVYIFSPATMWFQGNVYMSDMAVHFPFVIGVYTVLKMIIRQRFYSPKYIFIYCIVLFIMIYTSWLGVFFAFGVLVYSLLHVRDNRGFRVLILCTILITLLTTRIIIYQYARINGIEAYLVEAFKRYLVRGSVGDLNGGYFSFLSSYAAYFTRLFFNYAANYLPHYLLIAGFIYLSLSRRKMKIVFTENGYRFIWLSVLPVVLLHFVFLNYSTHDFTVLYASLFFSVLLGILYDKVRKSGAVSQTMLNRMAIGVAVVMMLQFTLTNLPGEKSIKGHSYAVQKEIGEAIRESISVNDVVFIRPEDAATPQLIFYAGTNIKPVRSMEDAKQFLLMRGLTEGVLYNTSVRGIETVEKINLASQ